MLRRRLGCAIVLTVGFASLGCRRADVEAQVEDRPAPPCSINGMLFRDTPATEFEQCGRSALPLDRQVAACVEAALRDQRPFVVELDSAAVVPVHRQPALAGASFDGHYRVRSYLSPAEGQGERTTVELVRTSPTAELSLMPGAEPPLSCLQSDAAPEQDDPSWRDLHPAGRHKFHAGRCLEWFDDAQWRRQAWMIRFEPGLRLECVSGATVGE